MFLPYHATASSRHVVLWLSLVLGSSVAHAEPEKAIDEKVECPKVKPAIPDVKRSDVYKDVPFTQGEEAKYELKYGLFKTLVGYGYMRVQAPLKASVITGEKDGKPVEDKRYHRVFQVEAYTGDWYKAIFAAHDKVQAFSRPWDFGITRFYIKQDESKPFSKPTNTEKWLDFEHYHCKVSEREVNHTKDAETKKEFDLDYGAVDVLGAVYKLRTFDYKVGKPERFLVYTSEKNWWLEAHPVAKEKIEVNAGKFDTVKLKMKTYIGKELQQKGELFVWIATDRPERPMVKVEGEVTFGSIYLLLDSFKPGRK